MVESLVAVWFVVYTVMCSSFVYIIPVPTQEVCKTIAALEIPHLDTTFPIMGGPWGQCVSKQDLIKFQPPKVDECFP